MLLQADGASFWTTLMPEAVADHHEQVSLPQRYRPLIDKCRLPTLKTLHRVCQDGTYMSVQITRLTSGCQPCVTRPQSAQG